MVLRGGRRIAGPGLGAALRADRSFLRDVQYRTDASLAARQSIYGYQQPPAGLPGPEPVAAYVRSM